MTLPISTAPDVLRKVNALSASIMFSGNWHRLGKAAMDRHSGIAPLNPLVIVVDGDAAVRSSLKFLLEIDGFAVRTYESAQELVREGDSSGWRCLIVDQDMPHMTGFELVAALRKEGSEVPVILISGNVTPALKTRASHLGIPVIEKAIMGNGLIELIRTTIGTEPH
ncbi:MAG: response regulator [Pseudolabrys sp.]